MWSFSEVIDGMTEACTIFDTPVISGNVSFYNETEGRGILPTPTIGVVGLLEDVRRLVTQGFKVEGDVIVLLGKNNGDLSVSEYSQSVLGNTIDDLIACGEIPKLDLELEKKVQDVCIRAAEEGILKSAHDCSDGGLAVAIAESCFSSLNRDAIGAEISLESANLSDAELLFGESPSRIVVTIAAADIDKLKSVAGDCPMSVIGTVKGESLSISIDGRDAIHESVTDLESVWANSLKSSLDN
jgi:phosphoribosylformylglycinamidine synthase